ncbi:hypothetical protein ACWJKU_02510 [Methylocaldum sp. MU1018]
MDIVADEDGPLFVKTADPAKKSPGFGGAVPFAGIVMPECRKMPGNRAGCRYPAASTPALVPVLFFTIMFAFIFRAVLRLPFYFWEENR